MRLEEAIPTISPRIVEHGDPRCNPPANRAMREGIFDIAALMKAPLGSFPADAVIRIDANTYLVTETRRARKPSFDLAGIERRNRQREEMVAREREEREREVARERERAERDRAEQQRYDEFLAAGCPIDPSNPDPWHHWDWECMGGSCSAGRAALLVGQGGRS